MEGLTGGSPAKKSLNFSDVTNALSKKAKSDLIDQKIIEFEQNFAQISEGMEK